MKGIRLFISETRLIIGTLFQATIAIIIYVVLILLIVWGGVAIVKSIMGMIK